MGINEDNGGRSLFRTVESRHFDAVCEAVTIIAAIYVKVDHRIIGHDLCAGHSSSHLQGVARHDAWLCFDRDVFFEIVGDVRKRSIRLQVDDGLALPDRHSADQLLNVGVSHFQIIDLNALDDVIVRVADRTLSGAIAEDREADLSGLDALVFAACIEYVSARTRMPGYYSKNEEHCREDGKNT